MLLALLADVHANLEALDAVLADVDAWSAEAVIVCAGDVVGYGPDPEACLARLRARSALCVTGNHELMVQGELGFERCVHTGIRAALWTRTVLSSSAWEHLARLPRSLRVGRDLVVCHGSLDDPEQYLASPRQAEAALAALARVHPEARLLVAGHTHHQRLYTPGGPFRAPRVGVALPLEGMRPWLVNPGAVGQSRDTRLLARYARYDAARATITFCELEYAHERTREKLARAGLASRLCMPAPSSARDQLDAWRTRWARWTAPKPSSGAHR